MAKQAGSLWVDGTTLRFVNANADEYYFVGDVVAYRSGAIPGSIWIDGANIRYITSDNYERSVPSIAYAGAGGVSGSIWVDTAFGVKDQLNFLNGGTRYYARRAVANTYNDSWSNNVHSDAGSFTAYQDVPAYNDTVNNGDDHQGPYGDTGGSHTDGAGYNDHSDTGHSDSGAYQDTHVDVPGYSDGFDPHGDLPHSDNGGANYTDHSHGDHSDAPPHNDHDDVAHADSIHRDNAHTNIAQHTDHAKVGHTDTPAHTNHVANSWNADYQDQPVYVGP